VQANELGVSSATATFGKNVSTSTTDPDVLNGWGKRGFNWEYTVSAQHQLTDRMSVNGGYYRRTFGNQTTTDNLALNNGNYDGPFCITAPSDPNLPGGGGYQVCGLYDLKTSAVAIPTNNFITFSDNFGGETNLYQGFDINLESRFKQGAFLRAGLSATARTLDQCNLLTVDSPNNETYPDGTSYCHREYPYRPDARVLGSYTLPWDIQFSGTYQFSRGVQTGGAGPSILATWAATNTVINPALGRNLAGANSKTIQLMREGLEYGDNNLNQLDLRASKRFHFGRYRIRGDFDLYNVFNSNWPYTVSSTFSTAANTQWLRPTNVLQSRFFKIGGQIDF